MESLDDSEIETLLERACSQAAASEFQVVASVATYLREVASSPEDPINALIAGLEYHLALFGDPRERHGPFGPMMEWGGGSYPAPLDRIEEVVPGTYSMWEQSTQLAPLALVRARFADLLWEARYGDRPHEFARIAIDAYMEAAGGPFGHPVELSEAVQRAVELASQINDPGRRSAAVARTTELCQLALADSDPSPGVALPLLELFVSDRPERRPPNVLELLDRAIDRFVDDPWNLEAALDVKARFLPARDREELHVREVEAFHSAASETRGLVKYAHLQRAIERAEDFGLRDLAEKIRREVEGMSEEDLDLKEISVEVSVPKGKLDAYINWFVGDDNLEGALTRFGARIPTGDPEKTQRQVQQLMTDYPFQFLARRMTIGPQNSLIRSTQGDDSQTEQAMVDLEARDASSFSEFAVDILERATERYGPISAAANLFETDLIESVVATKIGRALELYEASDFDSAASALAPRLERIVRRLSAAVGLSVTRSPDRRGRPGGVKGLGELLELLKGSVPERTRRYLRVLLTEVTGINLRNRVGHGLSDQTDQREAALLVQAACHLRLLVLAQDSGAGDSPS